MKRSKFSKKHSVTTSLFFAAMICLLSLSFARAALVDDIKQKISTKNTEIEKLEQEIEVYQNEIESLGNQANTFQNSIKMLDTTKRQLEKNIIVTEQKIDSTALTIAKLSIELDQKQTDINRLNEAIAGIMRRVNEADDTTLLEIVLSNDDLSSLLIEMENLQQFHAVAREKLQQLELLREELSDTRTESEDEKDQLVYLRAELSDKKKIVQENKDEKSNLLSKTKNKESNYQKILNEKKALKEQFEQQLLKYESDLRIAIDPRSLPSAGKGVLAWPLDKIRITQKFGNTEFAQSGAYSGQGHNGVDFGVAIGTPVKATLTGTVVETGNTDAYSGCYSYGKWVLIQHPNGLSTLYGHLSLIKVSSGQTVATGDVIGYSGNTGYTTGPHLHLTVFATQGVKIVRMGDIKTITNCMDARIPVAPLNAYLDPLIYL